MNRIQTFVIAIFCSFCSFSVAAQTPDNSPEQRRERLENIESARVAFLNEKMGLSPEQAQKFWPLYNELEAKRRDFRKQGRTFWREKTDNMSDKELQAAIDKSFQLRQKELDLEKAYKDKFLKIINLRQLAALYQAEREFTKVLLRRLDHQRPGGGRK